MYDISLQDFRGFHSQFFVEIRPITLLVGENSAGKSSFLAANKYMLDFFSGQEEPSFNKDPFQLGTFQQISHYRGGKAGRAKSFSISIRRLVRSTSSSRNANRTQSALFQLLFSNIDHQATISSAFLQTDLDSIRIYFDRDRLAMEYSEAFGRTYRFGEDHPFPRIARSDLSRYWRFLIREISYRLQRAANNDNEKRLPREVQNRLSYLSSVASSFTRNLSHPTEATSAIRTKPLRTYTPGIEHRDGEGSHVPFEMAKLHRSKNKDEWNAIKQTIDSFGKSSEMFRDIEIRSFGNTVSDPFQIQFSSGGPRTNIVDLGYGTSQVLPILYMIAAGGQNHTYLIQQPEVHLHPRAQSALGDYFINSFLKEKKRFILETHSDFIVDRIRLSVARGLVDPNDVSILFFERTRLDNRIIQIKINDSGEPISPPPQYRQFFLDEQLKLLGVE